ncbi:hypothetical protein AT05_01235 [Schleiferia thermophila str. Yellowstone]|nr:hypothetical protein AT05_01235 [Schleiferia thermophila str. Yellowstone]
MKRTFFIFIDVIIFSYSFGFSVFAPFFEWFLASIRCICISIEGGQPCCFFLFF